MVEHSVDETAVAVLGVGVGRFPACFTAVKEMWALFQGRGLSLGHVKLPFPPLVI